MACDWPVKSFAELIAREELEIGDGYRAKNEELGGNGLIFLRAGQVTDTGISFAGVDRFRITGDSQFGDKISRDGDVIITTKGNSTGRVSHVTGDMPRFVYSPHLSYWRASPTGSVRQSFLRAWSRGREFANQLNALSRATDMAPYLSLTDQRRLNITLPPPEIQLWIGELNDVIQTQIELLRATNATLEAIAQALFKSWFVDFDPVHTKAERRAPAGMDAATAALFPSEFEDSELGPIPKGWRVRRVRDVAKVIYGAPFASRKFNSERVGTPLVRIRDLKDETPGVWTREVHPKGYLLQPGDIVVGMDGEFRAYLWGGSVAWMNQRVCTFQPLEPHSAAFVRCAIEPLLAQVESVKTGTTVIHIGKGDIDRFRLIVPIDPVAKAFAAICQPIYDRVVANKLASRLLAHVRDTLLPRLISGKLRLPEAEETCAEA